VNGAPFLNSVGFFFIDGIPSPVGMLFLYFFVKILLGGGGEVCQWLQ